MNLRKNIFLTLFFLVPFAKAGLDIPVNPVNYEGQFSVSGILPKEVKAKAIAIKNGETVVSHSIVTKEIEGEIVEEKIDRTIGDIIDENPKNSFYIDLSKSSSTTGSKNLGDFSKNNPHYRKLIKEVETGNAVSCIYEYDNNTFHVIVSDKSQSELSICEKIKHQILLLQGVSQSRDMQTNAQPTESAGSGYSSLYVGLSALGGFGIASAGAIVYFMKTTATTVGKATLNKETMG